jgi:hypothetical protein
MATLSQARNHHYARRVSIAEMFRNCAVSYIAGLMSFPVLYAIWGITQSMAH